MEWKLLSSTFLLVFLAELGDKTQLATLGLAAGTPSRLAVFLGASAALIATTALAVLAGDTIGRLVPELWIRRAAGFLFLILGMLTLATARS